MAAYAANQRALLEAAAEALAPGGRLLYVTCSLVPEENEAQIDAFLSTHRRSFRRLRFGKPPRGVLLGGAPLPLTPAGDFQTLPSEHWMGLYAAMLEKSVRRARRPLPGR